MKVLFRCYCVVIYLCLNRAFGSDEAYRAGVIRGLHSYTDLESNPGLVRDAADAKLDVLLLSPPQGYSSIKRNEESYGLDNYDELVKMLSRLAQSASCYLVAHLLDNTKCQNRRELVRSNVVFNRRGEIVTEYRKPVSTQANCTSVPANIGSFATDLGVTVGLMMEEDLIFFEREDLRGLQNFVVAGGLSSNIPFLSDRTFVPTSVTESPGSPEDLSMYAVRPLDLKASLKGYKETICHEDFCCEFYVKTKFEGSQVHDVNFGLSAYSGVREYSPRHNIGAQTCAIFFCAGVHKTSCETGFDSNNTVKFEKISVTGIFSGGTQYPIATAVDTPGHLEFKSEAIGETNRVTLIVDSVKLSSFGIFGGDHSRDSVKCSDDYPNNGYVFNDQMHELFDYMWIRLRILIFLVSIYVLEML